MADGEELEYDSDPEDALRPSMMRRREASDDENGEGSCGEREIRTIRRERLRDGSDDESEGEGSARGYVEEEEYEDQGEEEMLDEEVDEDGVEGGSDANVLERSALVGGRSWGARELDGAAVLSEEYGQRSGGDVYREKNQAQEGEKKEIEPFAVPTAGAFYMHDDRFVENGRGRHRRMPGGRRLWESKDDQAWVHDRFEEMKLQDRRNEDGRMPRGRFRGRGSRRGRGAGRGYDRANRPRAYYGDTSNQNVIKSVRGRGPVRYEPLSNKTESYPNQSKRTQKTQDVALDNISAKFPQISDGRPESVAPRKQTFASNLSSASPPFYPSGSSNQDMAATQKREIQIGSNTKPLSSTMQMENYFSAPHPPSSFRGKTIVDSIGFDGLHLDDSDHQVSGKAPVHPSLHSSRSAQSLSNVNKSPSYRVQEKNSNSNSTHNHPTSFNQVGRISWQNQPPVVQQKPVQNQGAHSLKISNQQVAQHLLIGNQVASPPHPSVGISSEGEDASLPGTTTKSTFGKGKLITQGAGRGPFLYGGAQIIGPTEAVGLPHGDQNFAGTPALLPVMQFSGQHPRGLGVPAVGMALPGYVAQPGFGNSEMTWVPVLAGAAGALGASYCSPYITLDGNYYARPSGQASTSTSSIKEASGTKPTNALKPPQKNEIVNVEFGQRQNKPRRYSEMNFGQ